jgi:hypothetical protein
MFKTHKFFVTFMQSSTSLHCFIISSYVSKKFYILNILGSILKISGKKYSLRCLALHLVEMDMDKDPARQALDTDPDPDTPK